MAKGDPQTAKFFIQDKATGRKYQSVRGVDKAAQISGQNPEDLEDGMGYQGEHAKLGGGDTDTHFVKVQSHGRGKASKGELADHERAHSGKPGAKVRHGADVVGKVK